jgi:hypothetical protein
MRLACFKVIYKIMCMISKSTHEISVDSAERRALRSIGVETSNLYTGFIALIQRLLVPGAQIVGITPRSFCNGPYFRPFREDFLNHLELRRLHIFESRKAAFRTDNVWQENIIFHAAKGRTQPREMIVSGSSGEHGDAITETIFPFLEIVHPHDTEKFIHIPLVYACHFNGGTVHWPKSADARDGIQQLIISALMLLGLPDDLGLQGVDLFVVGSDHVHLTTHGYRRFGNILFGQS